MAERTVVVTNETGLHARPAASLVQFVKNYPGEVTTSSKEHFTRCIA